MSQTIHYAAFRCDVSIWPDVRDRDICRGQIVAQIVIIFHYNREKCNHYHVPSQQTTLARD